MLLTSALAMMLAAAPSTPSASARQVAQAINAFGLDLYSGVRSQPGNIFLSPVSVATGLEMANLGAGGATASELDAALHLTKLDREQMKAGFGELLTAWNSLPATEGTLAVVNRAWGSSHARFHEPYLHQLEGSLQASLQPVDFRQTEASRRTINSWVGQATHGKIAELLAPGTLTSDSRLVLTNAAYFLGQWTTPFPASATHDEPFHLASGESPNVPMMHLEHSFKVYGTPEIRVLELDYGQGALALDALLPNDPAGLKDLEASLTADRLDTLVRSVAVGKAEVALPRFKLSSQFNLVPTLQALGVKQAFLPTADFQAIGDLPKLAISQVVHQAVVETNEQGSEAAAATATVMKARALMRNRPFVFRADHPFLILIRDTRSGAVLFLGRVSDPRG